MKRYRLFLLVALAVYGVFSVWLKLNLLDRPDSEAGIADDAEAPALFLQSLDGDQYDLGTVVGENEVVIVNFWATWCGPCKIEMPQFQEIYEKHASRGLEILAITQEDRETVEEFLRARPYPFPILLDPEGLISDRYGVSALPTTFLVGSHGKVIRSQTGVDPFLERQIVSLLGEEEGEQEGQAISPSPGGHEEPGGEPAAAGEGGPHG